MAVASKGSIYEKRKGYSISVPLELDSDPEFDSGSYVYERKKKGRPSQIPKAKRSVRANNVQRAPVVHNVLQEYFGRELDLHSESETEETQEGEEGVLLNTSDAEEELQSAPDSPVILKAQPLSQGCPTTTRIVTQSEDSPTESDEEDIVECLKRKSFRETQLKFVSNKRQKTSADDDSATESDTDDELQMLASASRVPKPSQSDDSETESESESELPADLKLNPKPGFPLPKGQGHLKPMKLDHQAGVKVPASINTYLRQYQRDGVRFFWDQYKKGLGGVLGDDMGLGAYYFP